MSNDKEQNELLLTAYFDGQLDPADIGKVESLLQQTEYAQLLESWSANRKMLQALPKYHLKDSFTEEVLAAAKIEAASDDFVQLKKSNQPAINWRLGMAALASLAGLVLLTLFVFPGMQSAPVAPIAKVGDTPVGALSAENHPNEESPAEPTATDSVSTAQTADPVFADPGMLFEPQMLFSGRESEGSAAVESGQILKWLNDSGSSGSSQLKPRSLNILRIVLAPEPGSVADLESVLAANKIEVRKSEETDETRVADRMLAKSKIDLQVRYVVSTSLQMKKTIAQLSREHKATIQALRIPKNQVLREPVKEVKVSPNGIARPQRKSSAQELIPFEEGSRESVDSDADPKDIEEIDQLDQWFGLTSNQDSSVLVQYLLLIEVSK